MTHSIIFVPGKNPKPRPDVHREYLERCLRRGVLRHDPAIAAQFDTCRFIVAAWNFLYYRKHGSLDADMPWIERLIKCKGATAADMSQARHWSRWLTRLLYTLGDHAHWLIAWLPDRRVKTMIQDTLWYFENTNGIADRVRQLVKTEIETACGQSDSVCVASHSMGAVIAYESLWELTHVDRRVPGIDLFLTLGSPLGMNYVQKRLHGLKDGTGRYPAGIRKWVNVSAVGDLVAVDESVQDDFAPMVEQGLAGRIEDLHGGVYTAYRNDQGLNPHRSYGYLVHPEVGAVLAKWWGEGNDRGR